MVLISHRYKFIHLRNFKVAGSSVESFMGQFCIDPAEQSSYVYDDKNKMVESAYGIIGNVPDGVIGKSIFGDNLWSYHISAKDVKERIGEDMFQQYLKFCIIRNPYDRMVSMYHWSMRLKYMNNIEIKPLDFKTFCKHATNQGVRCDLQRILLDGNPVCDYYIRYENLKEDLVILLDKLGITDYNIEDLPNHKSQFRPKDKPYQDYYDDETRAIVADLFKTEIEMFGYTF